LEVLLGNPELLTPPDPNANPIETQFETELEARFKHVAGPFLIQPDGTLNLGPIYGAVHVAGLTIEQAEEAVRQHLRSYTTDDAGNPAGLKDPLVAVSLPDIAGLQQVAGEHLVRPDGTIALGAYGSVYVAGMTLEEVKYAVESHLSAYLQTPEVSVDVLSYNSKKIYVVTDGGGYGERVVQLPVTGNETVLDAISQIQGLSEVSSKKIWIARPAPSGAECAQVLDVHWEEITREGITTTNYQLLPGDRIFIEADHMISTDNFLAKLYAPFERTFGVALLGIGLGQRIEFYEQQGVQGGFGGGGGGGF
jgi:polysaccharide export outer membrane protein